MANEKIYPHIYYHIFMLHSYFLFFFQMVFRKLSHRTRNVLSPSIRLVKRRLFMFKKIQNITCNLISLQNLHLVELNRLTFVSLYQSTQATYNTTIYYSFPSERVQSSWGPTRTNNGAMSKISNFRWWGAKLLILIVGAIEITCF